MTAMERLRTVASGEWGMAEFDTADCAELLQEIDRMRAEAAGTREACARICDERAKIAAEASHDPSDDPWSQVQVAERLEAKLDEAESCAAAIRAGGKP